MFFRVGTILRIKDIEGEVIGYIKYANPQDGNKTWTEYRLRTRVGERWLSVDECYDEYSISWPANDVRGQIGPEWHKVDEGTQVVQQYGGDVDVDPGERANFVEYEDEEEEKTLSVEIWSDGAEYSKGEYIEKEDIAEIGYYAPKKTGNSKKTMMMVLVFGIFFVFFCSFISTAVSNGKNSISKYLDKSASFSYVTSITGNEKQEAKVYSYGAGATALTDDVAKIIINGIEGDTQSVTQKDDTSNEEIAILTDKEYCLIYHPEENKDEVYVQVSGRKYNYTSDNAPYKSSSSDTTWYRSHYYSSGYKKDATSYKNTPSAYTMYSGSTVHNIGNGYFDSYSNSVRQASVNNRSSSGGGLSSGK